jgi:hypothetical protein
LQSKGQSLNNHPEGQIEMSLRRQKYPGAILAGIAALALIAASPPHEGQKMAPYSSVYLPQPQTKTLIINGTILDGAGARMERADILIDQGRIVALGRDLDRPNGVTQQVAGSRLA